MVGLFQSGPRSSVGTKARSTKSHETARKRPVFRGVSCDFVDRLLTVKTKKLQNDPLRLLIGGTQAWLAFATWLTQWV